MSTPEIQKTKQRVINVLRRDKEFMRLIWKYYRIAPKLVRDRFKEITLLDLLYVHIPPEFDDVG